MGSAECHRSLRLKHLIYACAISRAKPLSKEVQKTIISSEHTGQGRSSTASAL